MSDVRGFDDIEMLSRTENQHFHIFNLLNLEVGIDFSRRNLTSVDVRF